LIVADASAVLELLLGGVSAQPAVTRLLDEQETLHAPHLLDVEIAQVLRRYVARGAMSAARGKQALEDYLDLRITRHPTEPLLMRIWELRANVTAYDAAYVALAEALDAPLVTADARLARSSGLRARIELI
jgi:predicted nucleic acid-binding protein